MYDSYIQQYKIMNNKTVKNNHWHAEQQLNISE